MPSTNEVWYSDTMVPGIWIANYFFLIIRPSPELLPVLWPLEQWRVANHLNKEQIKEYNSDVHYSDPHYNTCFSGDQEASNDADIPSSLKKKIV